MATFERLMEQVFVGMSWQTALVYLDDIIVHAKSFEDELRHLREVFTRLEESNLKLSPKKCQLFQRSAEFLGYTVSGNGIDCQDVKIETVRDWPTPKSPTEVKSFMGLCTYYRRFVHGFSDIAAPLNAVASARTNFSWGSTEEEVFNNLKKALIHAPILAYPTMMDEFVLDTDASESEMNAFLSKRQNGIEKAIAYYSRTWKRPERSYCD